MKVVLAMAAAGRAALARRAPRSAGTVRRRVVDMLFDSIDELDASVAEHEVNCLLFGGGEVK